MVSGDHAREGIIKNARETPTAPVIRYRDLKNGLAAFLSDPARPTSRLAALESLLEQKANDQNLTAFMRDDAQASLEALSIFRRFNNQLGGYAFAAPGFRANPLNIEGVDVSVHPNLVLTQTVRSDQRFGLALFRLAKGDDEENIAAASRRSDVGKFVATLAFMQAETYCPDEHIAHHSLCMSLDVQNQEIWTGSRNQTRRINNLRAACRQIARAW